MKNLNSLAVLVAVMLLGTLAITGCDETLNMAGEIVGTKVEPEDQVPVMTGDMKQPEEATAEQPAEASEEATEPAIPKDTTPPTVLSVEWYHDQEMTETVEDDIRPGDTIYTVVTFSEAVRHIVADDTTARPALSIVVDGMATRYRMLPHGVGFKGGEAKPLHGGTAVYLCKYTVPADTTGTIALRVGAATADVAGNSIAEASEYVASFIVAEPEVTIVLPDGYELPAYLIPTEPTVLSETERKLKEIDEAVGSGWHQSPRQYTTDSPADAISLLPHKDREEVYDLFVDSVQLPHFAEAAALMKEVNIKLIVLYNSGENKDRYYDYLIKVGIQWGYRPGTGQLRILTAIFFEENPELAEGRNTQDVSKYWIILEYYRLQLEHPDLPTLAETFNRHYGPEEDEKGPKKLLDLFRQSCRDGNVFGLDNPWQ